MAEELTLSPYAREVSPRLERLHRADTLTRVMRRRGLGVLVIEICSNGALSSEPTLSEIPRPCGKGVSDSATTFTHAEPCGFRSGLGRNTNTDLLARIGNKSVLKYQAAKGYRQT
jgi:hypothetical protein